MTLNEALFSLHHHSFHHMISLNQFLFVKMCIRDRIWAVSETALTTEYAADPCDVLLIGPQVRFRLNSIKEQTRCV